MELKYAEAAGLAPSPCADRIGFAKLTTMAFRGIDLRPLRDALIAKVAGGTAGAGDALDLSLIAQLLGDKPTGLAVQAEVLGFHQLYRSPCSMDKPKLRVLALAAAMDMGGNTPIEFLLEDSGIELVTLYVVAGVELPAPTTTLRSSLPPTRKSAGRRWPRSIGLRHAGRGRCSIRRGRSAISIATSCTVYCAASKGWIFRRRHASRGPNCLTWPGRMPGLPASRPSSNFR
jgi:hypothetical protein